MATDKQSVGLTERRIRDAKPGPQTAFLWDGTVRNLGVRITPKGAKAFVLFYRAAGRKRLATLARCSEISLREARERAGRELAAIREGESDPLERRRAAREAPTVDDALDRFFEEFAPARMEAGRLAERTVREYRAQADRYLRPALGTRRVADVTRDHVTAAVKGLKPTLRNRVLAFASRVFSLCETWEWRGQHTNPARGVERNRERVRDRVLAPSELSALAAALDDRERGAPFAVAAIRTAAMTALRISECLSMRWEHVSFETGRVVLPETKTGRRTVPLAAPVLALLHGLPRVNGCPFVFAGAHNGAPVGYRKTRVVFAEACAAAGLSDVRLHDLRRSVATNLAAHGMNAFTLRDVLGHKTLAMSNRYVRTAGDALADAMERAASFAVGAMAGESGEVVPMGRRHG